MAKSILKILMVLAMAAGPVLAVPYAGAEEARSRQLEEAKSAVEKSSLPREAKSGILTKADRAVAAGVPAEDVSVIVTRGVKQGVDSRSIEGFLDTATRAKEQNLPVRLILDRTEQGLAKGIPPEKIEGVTRQLSGHLAAARPIVNNLENKGLRSANAKGADTATETVARALEKSIPKNEITGIGQKVTDRKGSLALFNQAVDTMTTFAGNGMSHEQSARLVNGAIEKGYSERNLEAMERYMTDQLRKNRPMSEIVSGMNSRMEQGDMMRDTQMQGRPGGGSMGPSPGGMGGMGGMGGRR